MEPFLKLNYELSRKPSVQSGINDYLLHPERIQKQVVKYHYYAQSLNPCGHIEQDLIKSLNIQ
jgi:response regulator of citrate/malate metabolism